MSQRTSSLPPLSGKSLSNRSRLEPFSVIPPIGERRTPKTPSVSWEDDEEDVDSQLANLRDELKSNSTFNESIETEKEVPILPPRRSASMAPPPINTTDLPPSYISPAAASVIPSSPAPSFATAKSFSPSAAARSTRSTKSLTPTITNQSIALDEFVIPIPGVYLKVDKLEKYSYNAGGDFLVSLKKASSGKQLLVHRMANDDYMVAVREIESLLDRDYRLENILQDSMYYMDIQRVFPFALNAKTTYLVQLKNKKLSIIG